MAEDHPHSSPRWGSYTKLVVTLTTIVILGALLVHFHQIVVPILMAFVLAYLLHPIVELIGRKTPLSWGLVVNLLYLVFILILLILVTWGGVGLIGQIQNLISAVQNYSIQLPSIIENLSHQVFILGPIRFDFSTIDWATIGQQVISYVEPALGKMGGVVGTLAGGAASTVGWTAFVVIVSYFLLLESGGLRKGILHFDVPGYSDDIQRLSQKLSYIWNAFLRGQIIIFFSKVVAYAILMTLIGVHYSIGLALVAGFASFLPYIGPAINWIVIGLVSYFQPANPFGIAPLIYAIIAIGIALLIDQSFDNLVSPRIMARSLKVHPAFVLITAIIVANLIGLFGIIIAAPLLATLQLFGRYAARKMLDRDPWPPDEDIPTPLKVPKWLVRLQAWWRRVRSRKRAPLNADPPVSSGSGKENKL